MKNNIFEGVKVNPTILRRVYEQSLEDFYMGFEVEFYSSEAKAEEEVMNFSNVGLRQVKNSDIFYNTDTNDQALFDYIDENIDRLAEHTSFDEQEIEEEYFKDWFNDNPNWYEEYLEELGLEDDDEDAPDDDDVENIIMDEIRNGERKLRWNTLQEEINEKKRDAVLDEIDVLEIWWEENPNDLINQMEWELDVEYVQSEDDSNIILRRGGGYGIIASSLNNIVPGESIEYDNELHDEKDRDTWYIEPDSSLGETEYGKDVEIASPVKVIDESMEDLKNILAWMDEEGFVTTDKTGLHVSLSFDPKFEYTEDEIDWLKLAVLSGEEYLANEFNRLHNIYAVPQLVNVRQAAANNDIKTVKKWKGYDELRNALKHAISKDKYHSFNFGDFEDSGRIEFRIMGGEGYQRDWNKIEQTIMYFVFGLKLATDENLYRKEYLKKLASMLYKSQPTGLPTEKELYGTEEEESKILKNSILYKNATLVLRDQKEALRLYRQFIIESEKSKMREEPFPFAIFSAFLQLVKDQRKSFFKVIFESVSPQTRINMANRLIRKTAEVYGFTEEQFEQHFNMSVDEAARNYRPVVDEYLGLKPREIIAAILFPRVEEDKDDFKQWVLKRTPTIRNIPEPSKSRVFEILSHTDKNKMLTMILISINEHVGIILGARARVQDANLIPINENFRNIILEIIEMNGFTHVDLDYEAKDLGMGRENVAKFMMDPEKELEHEIIVHKYHNKYDNILSRYMVQMNSIPMLRNLLSNDLDDKLRGASLFGNRVVKVIVDMLNLTSSEENKKYGIEAINFIEEFGIYKLLQQHREKNAIQNIQNLYQIINKELPS
jgi:hypothetical protein